MPATTRRLSPPRRELLEKLVSAGGRLDEQALTVPGKRLMTRMERDALVQRGLGGPKARWGYAITDAGKAALS